MKGNRVFTTISPVLGEQLEARAKEGGCSTSQIISTALTNYFNFPDIKVASLGILTPADLEAIRNLFKTENVFSHPLTELVVEEIKEEPIQKGLIMPDMSKTRVRPDPNIKNSFHLSHDIRPGDGVVGRLRAAGIDPLEITKAKRNKRRGVEYDKSLEQYFDLL